MLMTQNIQIRRRLRPGLGIMADYKEPGFIVNPRWSMSSVKNQTAQPRILFGRSLPSSRVWVCWVWVCCAALRSSQDAVSEEGCVSLYPLHCVLERYQIERKMGLKKRANVKYQPFIVSTFESGRAFIHFFFQEPTKASLEVPRFDLTTTIP